jgi:peptidoglycan/xylan/chitin deacetylase (PgdA/CDA1 family)
LPKQLTQVIPRGDRKVWQMKRPLLNLILFILMSFVWASCGIFSTGKRQVASDAFAPKVNHAILERELNERLTYLHHYYLLGLIHLDQYEKNPEGSFSNGDYLSLEAIKSQVDEIEKEIERMIVMSGKGSLIKEKISAFSKLSTLHSLAMENLSFRLGLPLGNSLDLSAKELLSMYQALKNEKDFFIIEKNIDHLAHMMETKIDVSSVKFQPSSGAAGNVTGDEFPAKVWALTFEDGPRPEVTLQILKELEEHQLKATFFPLGTKGQDHPEVMLKLKAAGMEIASHSWSHLPLTKVSERELEEEISSGAEVQFFRLPYGDGVGSPSIREKLAEKNLIHVLWNVDALDWLPQSPLRIALRTKALMKKNKKDSGIILMHDTHPRSIIASSLVMEFLSQNGRRNCKIGEIVNQINEGAKTVCSK